MIEAAGIPHPCLYLLDQTARLSYLYPRHRLTPEQLDSQLAKGQRRSGQYFYYMRCDHCRACEPTRVIVDEFRWGKSLKRVEKRGDAVIQTRYATAVCDEDRVRLYNVHRNERALGDGDEASEQEYSDFLTNSRCQTNELSYWINGQLVGCSICDIGKESLSAVYTLFDPAYSELSIGTYAVLKMVRLAEQLNMKYVYLGLYVAKNRHLRYKARFSVQERFIQGAWVRFEEPSSDWVNNHTPSTDA